MFKQILLAGAAVLFVSTAALAEIRESQAVPDDICYSDAPPVGGNEYRAHKCDLMPDPDQQVTYQAPQWYVAIWWTEAVATPQDQQGCVSLKEWASTLYYRGRHRTIRPPLIQTPEELMSWYQSMGYAVRGFNQVGHDLWSNYAYMPGFKWPVDRTIFAFARTQASCEQAEYPARGGAGK